MEYATEWCIADDGVANEEITNKEVLAGVDARLAVARGIVPPDELRAYHTAQINLLTAVKSSLSLEPSEEIFNEYSLFVVALAVGTLVEQAENELSAETYLTLADFGCIDEEEVLSTPTPEPTPDVPGLTLDNPVPAGGILDGSDGTKSFVLSIVEDAWPVIKSETETSYWTPVPPQEGYRFLMIALQVSYASGTESVSVDSSNFGLIDDSRVLHTASENSCGDHSNIIPEELYGEIFAGGKIAGNICFEVRNEASDLILMYEPYWSYGDDRRFLRLD